MTEPQYRPSPYPTTVEEILAALQPPAAGPHGALTPQVPAAPVSVLLVNPAAGAFPVPATPYPLHIPPGHQAPHPHYVPLPAEPAAPVSRVSALSDAPLWLRLSVGATAFGIGTAGVGYGIGQAAPGIDALARLVWAAAALGAVGLVVWLLAPRQRQQQAPTFVTNITTTTNVSAGNSTAVGKQRNSK
jgi:hypothetical protein